MKLFFTKNKSRTSDNVKAHADAKITLKAFGVRKVISRSSLKIQYDGGVPSDELRASIDPLKSTADTAERSIRSRCASAHAVFLLNIFELLRKNALAIRPETSELLAKQFKATLSEQAGFGSLFG